MGLVPATCCRVTRRDQSQSCFFYPIGTTSILTIWDRSLIMLLMTPSQRESTSAWFHAAYQLRGPGSFSYVDIFNTVKAGYFLIPFSYSNVYYYIKKPFRVSNVTHLMVPICLVRWQHFRLCEWQCKVLAHSPVRACIHVSTLIALCHPPRCSCV